MEKPAALIRVLEDLTRSSGCATFIAGSVLLLRWMDRLDLAPGTPDILLFAVVFMIANFPILVFSRMWPTSRFNKWIVGVPKEKPDEALEKIKLELIETKLVSLEAKLERMSSGENNNWLLKPMTDILANNKEKLAKFFNGEEADEEIKKGPPPKG